MQNQFVVILLEKKNKHHEVPSQQSPPEINLREIVHLVKNSIFQPIRLEHNTRMGSLQEVMRAITFYLIVRGSNSKKNMFQD